MGFISKDQLTNQKFEQRETDVLNLSGTTNIFGRLNILNDIKFNEKSINKEWFNKIENDIVGVSGKTLSINNLKKILNNNYFEQKETDTLNLSGITNFHGKVNIKNEIIFNKPVNSNGYKINDLLILEVNNDNTSISLGSNNKINKVNSIVIGNNNISNNENNITIGINVINNINNSVGFGWNKNDKNEPTILFSQENDSYILGKNPKIGIGEKCPKARIDIKTSKEEKGFRLNDTTQVNNYVLTTDDNGFGSWKPIFKIFKTDLTKGKNLLNHDLNIIPSFVSFYSIDLKQSLNLKWSYNDSGLDHYKQINIYSDNDIKNVLVKII